MSTLADDTFPKVDRVFDAALYPEHVLDFIDKHIGERPGVARTDPEFPHQEAAEVIAALDRFADLEELVEVGRLPAWVGKDAVRESIAAWRERQKRYLQHKRNDPQGKGFHPEMYTFDSRGKPHWQGTGSDSGRVRWPLELVPVAQRAYTDFTRDLRERDNGKNGDEYDVSAVATAPTYTREDCVGDNYIQCPVAECNERFTFDPDSKITENVAWQKFGQHCKKPKSEVDEHRLALNEVLGG